MCEQGFIFAGVFLEGKIEALAAPVNCSCQPWAHPEILEGGAALASREGVRPNPIFLGEKVQIEYLILSRLCHSCLIYTARHRVRYKVDVYKMGAKMIEICIGLYLSKTYLLTTGYTSGILNCENASIFSSRDVWIGMKGLVR